MGIYEELVARGLIAQVTDENEIRDMVNNGKATFYIGFDCTADSLHVGHFMALCLMKRLQMAGNKPIALIGDGTTLIGDPSGRTDMRKMLTKEDIRHNAECFKRQMEKFIDFSDDKALMLYNSEWLVPLNYIELLREVGACFSVNNNFFIGNCSAFCFKVFNRAIVGFQTFTKHSCRGINGFCDVTLYCFFITGGKRRRNKSKGYYCYKT